MNELTTEIIAALAQKARFSFDLLLIFKTIQIILPQFSSQVQR